MWGRACSSGEEAESSSTPSTLSISTEWLTAIATISSRAAHAPAPPADVSTSKSEGAPAASS